MEFCGKKPQFKVGETVCIDTRDSEIEGTILDEGILGSKLSTWYFSYLVEFEYNGKPHKEWFIEPLLKKINN